MQLNNGLSLFIVYCNYLSVLLTFDFSKNLGTFYPLFLEWVFITLQKKLQLEEWL